MMLLISFSRLIKKRDSLLAATSQTRQTSWLFEREKTAEILELSVEILEALCHGSSPVAAREVIMI